MPRAFPRNTKGPSKRTQKSKDQPLDDNGGPRRADRAKRHVKPQDPCHAHAGPARDGPPASPAGLCRAASNSCTKPRAKRNKDAQAAFRLRPPKSSGQLAPPQTGLARELLGRSRLPGDSMPQGRWHGEHRQGAFAPAVAPAPVGRAWCLETIQAPQITTYISNGVALIRQKRPLAAAGLGWRLDLRRGALRGY